MQKDVTHASSFKNTKLTKKRKKKFNTSLKQKTTKLIILQQDFPEAPQLIFLEIHPDESFS